MTKLEKTLEVSLQDVADKLFELDLLKAKVNDIIEMRDQERLDNKCFNKEYERGLLRGLSIAIDKLTE